MKQTLSIFIVIASMLWLTVDAHSEDAKKLYTCGMHPQVIQDHPGNCPICGMKLTPIRKQVGNVPAGERKIKFYKSTMTPGETSPTPAKDSMGMDMVPVYEDGSATTDSTASAVDAATMQNMNLRTADVQRGALRKTIRTVGTIDYNETALADVTTKFKGWIEKLNVDATGQLVHRGEPMFEIYSPELYSAEVEFIQVLKFGSTNDPATETLRETAASKLRFFDVPEAQIAELKNSRKVLKTLPVSAPMSGFVIEKNVVSGQMVDAGMRLYRIADLGIVWVIAQVYEQDLPFVKLGQEAIVKVASLPDREFRGRVTFIYPSVDEKTRTAKVRLEFENPGYYLKPGMFVSAQIHAQLEDSAVLVPESAVLRSGAKNTVFVALAGGKFVARDVALGVEAENGMNQVISGLKAGEHIVTSGQFLLDSESQLREAIEKMRGPTTPVKTEVTEAGSTHEAPATASVTPGTEPVVYVCPMPEHASVHEDKPGKYPLCQMTLIPVMAPPTNSAPTTIESSSTAKPAAKQLYTCPMHPEVISDQPGKCPKCEMDLVPVKSK